MSKYGFYTGVDTALRNNPESLIPKAAEISSLKGRMALPFQPLSIAFDHVNYYIDMPTVNFFTLYLLSPCHHQLCIQFYIKIAYKLHLVVLPMVNTWSKLDDKEFIYILDILVVNISYMVQKRIETI